MTPTLPRFGASGHTGAVRSSAHGAVRLVRDALATLRRANVTGPVLVRADSAYYQQALVAAAIVKTVTHHAKPRRIRTRKRATRGRRAVVARMQPRTTRISPTATRTPTP